MAKMILLIMFLAIVSFFSGRTLMLASGVITKREASVFASFSAGSLFIICISFISHLLALRGDGLVLTEKHYSGILMVVTMTAGYFAFVILAVIKGRKKEEKEKKKNKISISSWVFLAVAVILTLGCFLTITGGLRINSTGDETLETVVTFLKGARMYTVDPLTGAPYSEGLPSRYTILCLPGFYSVLCNAFAQTPETIVHSVMPGFWFLSGLFSMIALSGSLFSGATDSLLKRSVFISSAVLFIFASDLSAYAQGFSVLSSMWTGAAIRIWVLIPFMLYCLFEKKYVSALLPVLCEVFICRTMYGIGFCACIYFGFVFLVFVTGRRKCSEAS